MRIEITIPSDKKYVERLFECLDKIEGDTSHKSVRLRKFIIEEFRKIRAKYNGNQRVDMEAIIKAELERPLERPVYQNTKLDKYRVKRFDTSIDDAMDKIAKIIRSKKSENS
jgi:hypothetical protein